MEIVARMWEGSTMPALELEVAADERGQRLDVWLARRVSHLSRARAKTLLDAGSVRVNGRLAPKSRRVAPGDVVTLEEAPSPSDFDATPDETLELPVLFESDRFVVVDKPVGVPSHPLREGEVGTVANALVARFPEMRRVGYRRREPGILHRLDTYTSGVMLAARDRATFEALQKALRAGEIEKRYLARCTGLVDAPNAIEAPIANDPRDTRKVRVCTDPREIKRLAARPARTEILRSTAAPMGSLVEARANHARRHQIRAHLAWIGHPLLGDTLYGGPALDPPGHHLLHASRITVEGVTVESGDWEHGV